MLVSLEQSLAEPADSIIHFLSLCIRLCVPSDGSCSEDHSARGAGSFARLPSKVQPKVFLAKCHHLDVAVKLLLGGFESIRGFANLGNEARGMDGFGRCVCD